MQKPTLVLRGPADGTDDLVIEVYPDGDVLIEHTDDRRYLTLTRDLLTRIAQAAGVTAPVRATPDGQPGNAKFRALWVASQRLQSGRTASVRKESDGTWSVNVYRNGQPVRKRFATRQEAREAFSKSIEQT